jgi:hypothetical protein
MEEKNEGKHSDNNSELLNHIKETFFIALNDPEKEENSVEAVNGVTFILAVTSNQLADGK